MRHNHRPAILASTLPASQLSLHPGEAMQYVCADCGRWTLLRRGIALSHRATDGVKRCPGSGQRLIRDVNPAQWSVRLAEAFQHAEVVGQAALRRPDGARVRPKAGPPTPRAVHQIATAR